MKVIIYVGHNFIFTKCMEQTIGPEVCADTQVLKQGSQSSRQEGVTGLIQRSFSYFSIKNIYYDSSLEPSRQDGSNEGSQYIFKCRNVENYP